MHMKRKALQRNNFIKYPVKFVVYVPSHDDFNLLWVGFPVVIRKLVVINSKCTIQQTIRICEHSCKMWISSSLWIKVVKHIKHTLQLT